MKAKVKPLKSRRLSVPSDADGKERRFTEEDNLTRRATASRPRCVCGKAEGPRSGRSRCAGALGSNPRDKYEELLEGRTKEKDEASQGTPQRQQLQPLSPTTVMANEGTKWKPKQKEQRERNTGTK